MRFYKKRQLYMLQMVSTYLKKTQSELYARVPVLRSLIAEYHERFEKVYKMETSGRKKTILATSEKQDVKKFLIKSVLKMVRMLRTVHYHKKDNKTEQKYLYTFSDLDRAGAEALPKMCKAVIDAAKKVKNLRIYGLDAGDIADAQAYLKEYASVKDSPKLYKKNIAVRNLAIIEGMKDCISFLENNIDPMVEIATEGNAELNAGYFSRRKVLVRGPGNITEEEAKYRKSRKRVKKGKGNVRNS